MSASVHQLSVGETYCSIPLTRVIVWRENKFLWKTLPKRDMALLERRNIYKLWIAIKVIPQRKAAHSIGVVCFGSLVSGLIAAIEATRKSRDSNKLFRLHIWQYSVTNGGYEIAYDFNYFKRFPKNGVKYIIYALMALIHTAAHVVTKYLITGAVLLNLCYYEFMSPRLLFDSGAV